MSCSLNVPRAPRLVELLLSVAIDMEGELLRIKSRRVNFHRRGLGEIVPREKTEKDRVEQLRVPRRGHGSTTSVF